ncbi:MAG: hypothetical protein N5P05_001188 [Chroococcopsis gigantea SAG 12.99]|jgi:hypothetical protein|nr:hypothetical protein [Chlorogloea purpurea SAG 13.99]MDV2999582.1 hypothetical protein [Chroococcopsis gigantea SAG 12.99]
MNPETNKDTEIKIENFQVFPKHVGVWEGEWLRLDAKGQEIARFTAILTKRIVDNRWIQANTYHYSDGNTVTHNFVGTAIAQGVIAIVGIDSPFGNFDSVAEEHGDNLIIFNVRNKVEGTLIGTETINLVRPDYCVRTSVGFGDDGNVKSFMIIKENRLKSNE